MRFASECGRFSVRFSKDALAAMARAADADTDRETGGILVGRYGDDLRTAYVEQVEEMPSDSAATSTRFVRGTRGLRALLQSLWTAPQRSYYLGEWHHHPSPSTTPSGPDLAQMRSIALAPNYHCPEPVLVILGKTASLDVARPMYVAVTTASECIRLAAVSE